MYKTVHSDIQNEEKIFELLRRKLERVLCYLRADFYRHEHINVVFSLHDA